jgi:outer membrane protein assembly factor BamB
MASGRAVRGGGWLLVGWVLWAGCTGCGSDGTPDTEPPPVSPAPSAPGSGSDASAPDASAPDGSSPDASAPDGSAPDASTPDGSTPDASTPGTGETRWLRHLSEPKHEVSGGVAVGAAGAVYSAATHGVESSYSTEGDAELRAVLTRLGADGTEVWTRTFPVTRPPPMGDIQESGSLRLHVAAGGTEGLVVSGMLRGSVDFGGGPLQTGAFLARLSAAGEHRWSRQLPAGHEVMALASDAAGNAYVGVLVQGPARPDGCIPSDGRVAKYSPQGTLLWEVSIGEPQCDGNRAEVRALSVDGEGQVALGGAFSGELRFGERRFSTAGFSPYFAKLGASGGLVWLQPLSSAWGEVTGIGTSARGTVVATGRLYRDQFEWAGTRVESPGGLDTLFLLVAESGGEARWAKSLGAGERPVLSVEPSGSVVVAGLTRTFRDPQRPDVDPLNNPQVFASRYTLEGTQQWQRIFRRGEGRPDLFAEQVMGAAMLPGTGGSCILGGQFTSPTDFGTGPRTNANTDTFVLRLAP